MLKTPFQAFYQGFALFLLNKSLSEIYSASPKLCGVPNGVRRRSIYLEEKDVTEFEQNNLELLDDRLNQVARDFEVNPEKLLSHMLVFEIPLASLVNALNRQDPAVVKENADYRYDTDRKIISALRKSCYGSIANEVLSILSKFEENEFSEAKE